ncbi:MAG: helix-turn-helix domain-containing protein [Ktedonobacteraceae bacterium]|nr:helix-turn-helix domain-containing protein [Ktedonobacteraceae bacterium]
MDENNVSEFARLITQLRQKRGLSQGQLAQATQLSRTYVYHLETGQRTNPSPHVVQSIARALDLPGNERQHLYEAFTTLTGQVIDAEPAESALLDLGDLARLLVYKTSYPTHSLTRLWYLHSWNSAAIELFEVQDEIAKGEPLHLLELVFDPEMRRRLHGWEQLARRLISDFLYNTRTLTHLPEYRTLWKRMREMPDFKRIAASAYPHGKPTPSFMFRVQHSRLGMLALRTATTVFTGINSYSMVSYVPGDQQTLAIYQELGW